ALLCWVVALGPNTFLFDWVKHIFPWSRYPMKFALFPVILVPILAAVGIPRFSPETQGRQRRFITLPRIAMLVGMGRLLWLGPACPLRDDNWGALARNTFWRALSAASLLAGVLWLARGERPPGVRVALQVALLALLPLDAFTHNPGLVPT